MPTIPTIHLNGTSASALVDQLSAAVYAAEALEAALMAAAPNGRDYYPQGPGAILAAGAEHSARLVSVATIKADLFALWEGIQNQPGGL